MEILQFSAATLAGYGVSGVCMILLTVAVVLIWQKRTHAPIPPMVAGAIVFPVFALGLKLLPAYFLLYHDNPVAKAVTGSTLLTALVAGGLAGVFEETGRFIAFSLLKKKYTAHETAISYGIGHGGFEVVYIAMTMISLIAMGIMVNTGHIDELTKDLPPEQIPVAMEQIRGYASQSFGMSMLGIVERIFAMCLHVGLSVMVFRAAYDKPCFWLYPAAVVLHTAVDFCVVMFKSHVLLVETGFALCSVLLLALAIRFLYRTYEPKEASA